MLVPFSEYDLDIINNKYHEFNSEWVDKIEEFLTTYKFKDEDISWKRNLYCPSCQRYLTQYSITTEFKDLQYFYKYGYEKCGANKELSGYITVTVVGYNYKSIDDMTFEEILAILPDFKNVMLSDIYQPVNVAA